jgi:Fe-S oxidoreductase
MVREHYVRAAGDDGRLREEVELLAPRVLELSEVLVDRLGVEDVGAYFPHRVTYHPTCHGLRMLAIGDRPLRLLKAVKGIDYVELPQANECCGFGGTPQAAIKRVERRQRQVHRRRRRPFLDLQVAGGSPARRDHGPADRSAGRPASRRDPGSRHPLTSPRRTYRLASTP